MDNKAADAHVRRIDRVSTAFSLSESEVIPLTGTRPSNRISDYVKIFPDAGRMTFGKTFS
jgi:hypothetical protein